MKKISFLALAAIYAAAVQAQSSTTDVDVNLKGNSGGGFPWMWVVGGIIFIVLLVALLGGRRGTDRVVEKKTVVRD